MRKFKDFVLALCMNIVLDILIWSCVLVLWIIELFEQIKKRIIPKEQIMPKKITVDMLASYMQAQGEDIFEDAPDDEVLCADFGDFLIQQYPQHKDDILAMHQEADDDGLRVTFFDYAGIEVFIEEDPDTGIELIYTAFVNFCNERDDLRAFMLNAIGEHANV